MMYTFHKKYWITDKSEISISEMYVVELLNKDTELLSFVERLFLSWRCYLATPLNSDVAKL